MSSSRTGIWLIGAKGSVATTAIVGLAALKQKLVGDAGLVTRLPQFQSLDLVEWSSVCVGGHEIRATSLAEEAQKLANALGAVAAGAIQTCKAEIDQIESRIRPGTVYHAGPTIEALATMPLPSGESPHDTVGRLQADIEQFARSERLDHVVVVNVASTEPPVESAALPARWADFEKLLLGPDCPLPASTLYAIAAMQAGASYVNFTPSLGSAPPAIDELARLRGTRHYGCDGKTGETLLKSVLAPMFAQRNLSVMSWVGHNIFGNLDGRVLDDPANKQTKIASKDRLLAEILGYRPQTHVSIEWIESLGEWKTAWDHIHFLGFLGVPMTFQFTWQGCDSALAAPLVLDLVRLTELAWRRGETGPLTFLASFFKSPYGVKEHGFDRQFQMLEAWAATSPI